MKEFNCAENCPDLGHCCREFAIIIRGKAIGETEQSFRVENAMKVVREHAWPFVTKHYDYKRNRWMFQCPELAPDGKCAIYDSRPSLCRDFKPKTDRELCCVNRTLRESIEPILSALRCFFRI